MSTRAKFFNILFCLFEAPVCEHMKSAHMKHKFVSHMKHQFVSHMKGDC